VISISVADARVNKQLVILLIFVNNEHFVNAVTMGKVSHVDKMRMQTMREQGFGAKAIIRAYPHKQWKLSRLPCTKFVAALMTLDQRSNARTATS